MADRRPGSTGPQRIGAALDRLLGTMRAPRVDVVDAVFSRWSDIVGDDVAAHCRPVRIDATTLVVEATDATWASELRWLRVELLERVAATAGTDRITELDVRVAPRK